MNLDDIMTAGSLLANIALGIVVCRNTLANQETSERVRVFEIMQERGKLPTSRQIQQEIWEEEAQATKQIEAAGRQQALPAPRRDPRQRQVKKNVTKSPNGYDPDNESYVDNTQPILLQGQRRPVNSQSTVNRTRTTDYNARTVRVPSNQRRHYGYAEDEYPD